MREGAHLIRLSDGRTILTNDLWHDTPDYYPSITDFNPLDRLMRRADPLAALQCRAALRAVPRPELAIVIKR